MIEIVENNNEIKPDHGNPTDPKFNLDNAKVVYTDHDIDCRLHAMGKIEPAVLIKPYDGKTYAKKTEKVQWNLRIGQGKTPSAIDGDIYPIGALLIERFNKAINEPTTIEVDYTDSFSITNSKGVQHDLGISKTKDTLQASFTISSKFIKSTSVKSDSKYTWKQSIEPGHYWIYSSMIVYASDLGPGENLSPFNPDYQGSLFYINGRNFLLSTVYRNDLNLTKTEIQYDLINQADFFDYLIKHPSKWQL